MVLSNQMFCHYDPLYLGEFQAIDLTRYSKWLKTAWNIGKWWLDPCIYACVWYKWCLLLTIGNGSIRFGLVWEGQNKTDLKPNRLKILKPKPNR